MMHGKTVKISQPAKDNNPPGALDGKIGIVRGDRTDEAGSWFIVEGQGFYEPVLQNECTEVLESGKTAAPPEDE